ncbi:SRPBCC domain-containing protein [Paenibacillus albidus]|uniref:SRPBCC family protein n=1 Tax=Paenibacillus albidus TaxID=2041023 RepID=UPI001BEC60FA|nr:SRPBCC domain-containing protein [Paenibacillus albidus]MBT2292790.1 SRPBCC domain-containing protein [Paenibacillus albidus]
MSENNELVITREFAAPRDLVFKVWSEAEHLKNWWGPKGSKLEVARMDFRPGGVFHFKLMYPEGPDMWAKFTYLVAESPERIVYVSSFSDPEGQIVRAPFSDMFPLEIRNEVLFTEAEGKTIITLTGTPINMSVEEMDFYKGMFDSMNHGFRGTFDQLAEYLEEV